MSHNKPVPGMMRFLCFTVCLGVLFLCFLYFTPTKNNFAPLDGVACPTELPEHPLGSRTGVLNNSNENNSLNSLMKEWLRQRRARVDWKNIIKPCVDNMAWGLVKWGKTDRSNATTSDIVFKDIRPAGEFSKVFIQSKTSDNRTKLIGGDTWRVYVRGPTSIAASVFDHNNGTYEALFLITEPGVYQLMIYLDYSLCDGFKDPPRDWFIKGDIQGTNHRSGALGPLDEYLVKHGHRALNITVTKTQIKAPLSGK